MNSARSCPQNTAPVPGNSPTKLLLATSNPGKVEEFRALATTSAKTASTIVSIELIPDFAAIPPFPEDAPTFAENAAGKALYYSRHCQDPVFADDSGLVVPALGGAPGVQSARYAGPNATSEQRIAKLLSELTGKREKERDAYFVCVLSVALCGRVLVVVSEAAHGQILDTARGSGGFGYDPIFFFPQLQKTFAELSREEKNEHSHRGKAFRRLLKAFQQT